jgi:formylglycine-generating enzyme required for sulfatase activity
MRAIVILLGLTAAAAEPGMSLIPRGSFQMGRSKVTPDDKTNMRPHILLDDRPVHEVAVDAFWLDTHETTHAQYAEYVKAKKIAPPYHWRRGEMPSELAKTAIYNVSWEEARGYCEFRGKRLPTEAEWERAARGGVESADYPWGDKFDAKLARHNTEAGPGEPGRYPPNAFGLHDMAGNMSEWTADWFVREYYKDSPAKNPKGPETGAYKVIRGGAWSDPPKRITVYFRNWVRPTQRQPNIGVRCAKDSLAPERAFNALIGDFKGTVSLHGKNLVSGAEFSIKPGAPVRTASTIKLPILIAVFQAVHEGKAKWDEPLELKVDDKVSSSGILREFSPGQYRLRELANLMIVVSGNTATNLILDRFTAAYVSTVMEKYGFAQTRSNRKILGDGRDLKPNPSGWSAFGQMEENKKFGIGASTPREMVRIVEMLAKGQLVSEEASKEILAIMQRQQYKDGIGRNAEGLLSR